MNSPIMGVAVGSQELKVLRNVNGVSEEISPENEGEQIALADDSEAANENGEKKGESVLVLPYNDDGISEIIRLSETEESSTVVLAGNYSWAKNAAYALSHHGLEVRYVSPRKAERGSVLSQVKFLENALMRGAKGRPFFGEQKKVLVENNGMEEVPHPWYALALKGERIMDEVRESKHHILNQLRLIFPELISLELKLWGKKALAALEEERFGYFSRYGLDYGKTLARYLPASETRGARNELKRLLNELREIETREQEYRREVNLLTRDHPVVLMFPGSETAKELALLIGWKNWGRTKKDFRRLRKYAGLAVSRVDSKGNPRISRERPIIRTKMNFVLTTTAGKQIITSAEASRSYTVVKDGEEVVVKYRMKKKPKRMEVLLKEIWKNCLREE